MLCLLYILSVFIANACASESPAVSTVTKTVIYRRHYGCHRRNTSSLPTMSTIDDGGRTKVVWCSTSVLENLDATNQPSEVSTATSFVETVAVLTAQGMTLTTRIQVPENLGNAEKQPKTENVVTINEDGEESPEASSTVKRALRFKRQKETTSACDRSKITVTTVSTSTFTTTRTKTASTTTTTTAKATDSVPTVTKTKSSKKTSTSSSGQMSAETTTISGTVVVLMHPITSTSSISDITAVTITRSSYSQCSPRVVTIYVTSNATETQTGSRLTASTVTASRSSHVGLYTTTVSTTTVRSSAISSLSMPPLISLTTTKATSQVDTNEELL
jgi:hypothetical protein